MNICEHMQRRKHSHAHTNIPHRDTHHTASCMHTQTDHMSMCLHVCRHIYRAYNLTHHKDIDIFAQNTEHTNTSIYTHTYQTFIGVHISHRNLHAYTVTYTMQTCAHILDINICANIPLALTEHIHHHRYTPNTHHTQRSQIHKPSTYTQIHTP